MTNLRQFHGFSQHSIRVVIGGGVCDDDEAVGHVGAVAVLRGEHSLPDYPQHVYQVETRGASHCFGQHANRLHYLVPRLEPVHEIQK